MGSEMCIRDRSDSPCSSDHDEYSDPLQIAASAGARLSTPEKANISGKRKVQPNPEEKTCVVQSTQLYPRGIELR